MKRVLEVKGLNKTFDGVTALTEFSCDVYAGEVLGLIGPNGAGKTTFFNVVTGFIAPDRGSVKFNGREIVGLPPFRITSLGISRTFQKLRLIKRLSVLQNVLLSFRDQPGEELRNVFFNRRINQIVESKNGSEALTFLEGANLVEKANSPANELSFGQQKLLTLICRIVAKPELLLLDEPIAGIAPEMSERISSMVCDFANANKSVVLIEHNIDSIVKICDRVIFVDRGAKICEGSPEEVRSDPRVIESYLN